MLHDKDKNTLIFFPDRFPPLSQRVYTTYVSTTKALERSLPLVLTTQMSFLDTRWLDDYDIAIADSTGHTVSFFICVLPNGQIMTSPAIKRELRGGNNLFRLWKSGEFDA